MPSGGGTPAAAVVPSLLGRLLEESQVVTDGVGRRRTDRGRHRSSGRHRSCRAAKAHRRPRRARAARHPGRPRTDPGCECPLPPPHSARRTSRTRQRWLHNVHAPPDQPALPLRAQSDQPRLLALRSRCRLTREIAGEVRTIRRDLVAGQRLQPECGAPHGIGMVGEPFSDVHAQLGRIHHWPNTSGALDTACAGWSARPPGPG